MTEPQIYAITLVAEDLDASERFYIEVLKLTLVFSDDVSRVFKLGNQLINVLDARDAMGLFAPSALARVSAGHRSMITLQVEDVDHEAARLAGLGVLINNGPVDQPWGIRALTFADPTGQLWEFSQELS